MIPRLLHQTARSRDLPPRLQRYVSIAKALHPEWEHHLWTDDDNHTFVRREFPKLLTVYDALPRNIMRADLIRYLFMSRLGGLYVDTDYEFLKPFDLLNHDLVLPQETDPKGRVGMVRIANAIFASTPGHPFWSLVIDEFTADPPLSPDADVLETTGPGFITRVYQKARAAGMDVHTPAGEVFCPITPRNPRQYQAIARKGVSYGIHHCFGSWRIQTPMLRVRMAVSRVVNQFR